MTLNRRKALQLAGSSTLLAMPFVQRARAEDKILNVYNWADYIGETTIEDFQKATGIAVTYDTYSSTDEMQAKMLAGSTGYDVVDMAGISLSRFVAAKIYQKIDRTKLPNWKNLDPVILNILEGFDPGIQYSMPYMWGSVGFTYNVDMVKERIPDADLDSMDLVMKPELAQKLSDCGISWLDEPTDTIMLLLDYLGKPRNVYAPADMDAVVEAFKKIRSTVRTFDSTNYLNALPNSELCVANNWSGDYSTAKARAAEAGVKINLAYSVPKTGAPAWFDVFCIPADAKNVENAHTFLNYMMEPEGIAKCTNFTNYATANLASKAFLNPDVLANSAVYPTDDQMKRLWTPKPLTEEQDRALTETFNRMKAG